MPNAAEALYDLLESWAVPGGQTPAASRGLTANDAENWRQQALAASYLVAVERYLQGMKLDRQNVDVYLERLPAWYAAVFNLTLAFGDATAHPRKPLDAHSRDLLRSLAVQMSTTGDSTELPADRREQLLGYLSEAFKLISSDTVIDTTERRHVMALIQQSIELLSSSGGAANAHVRSVVQEAAGATLSVAVELRGREAEKSSRLATLGIAIATSVATTLTGEGLKYLTALLSAHPATSGVLPPSP